MEQYPIEKQIEDLRNQIRHHDYLYYCLDNPEISDFEYDKLFKQLQKLENENPLFITPDSPTQRVSSGFVPNFCKAIRVGSGSGLGCVTCSEPITATK